MPSARAAIWRRSPPTRAAFDAGVKGERGRGAVRPRRAGAAPAPRRAGHPQHVRYGHGAFKQPAPAVLALSLPPLPERTHRSPSLLVAAGKELVCPECGAHFYAPSAEELAFNSQGACKTCGGTGIVRTVDLDTLVPDDSLTIDGGAVAPWNSLMWSLMTDICREMGVRTDVPFRDLTEKEKDIVFHGPAEKKHIFYHNKNSGQAGELDFTYFNAVYTVENALAKVKDEKGMKLARAVRNRTTDVLYVLDEPSIGLHPLDVQVLLRVFQALIDNGATVVVIEHDLDVIRNADYIIDMGPGGGDAGGTIAARSTPEDIRANTGSITGRYL